MAQKPLGWWETEPSPSRSRPLLLLRSLSCGGRSSSGPCKTSAHARVRAHSGRAPQNEKRQGPAAPAHAKAAPTREIFVAFPPCSHALAPLDRQPLPPPPLSYLHYTCSQQACLLATCTVAIMLACMHRKLARSRFDWLVGWLIQAANDLDLLLFCFIWGGVVCRRTRRRCWRR